MDESSDGEINWLKSFKPILKGGSKYFVIDESFLLALGVKVHVKQRGFKDLDHILERHGKWNLRIFSRIQCSLSAIV